MSPRKQILLVEPDASLRTAAEKVMRQAGHEVVSVDSASRAEGILTVSNFDLAVLGLQVKTDNNLPFYQYWAEDSERAGAPFILLCSETDSAPDLPKEAIVRCPFSADELIAKVNIFTGANAGKSPKASSASTSGGSLFGDEAVEGALDKALGLDQIDVHESEVLGATDSSEIKTIAKSESLVGYDAEITSITSSQKGVTDTSKIDLAFIQNKLRDMAPAGQSVSESARLDVAPVVTKANERASAPQSSENQAPNPAAAPIEGDHDYEWFMSEMQAAGIKPATKSSQPEASSPAPAGPASANEEGGSSDSVFEWSEAADSDQVASVFSKQMAEAVASRVAEKLVKQLNSDKFVQLIKQEMKAYLKDLS